MGRKASVAVTDTRHSPEVRSPDTCRCRELFTDLIVETLSGGASLPGSETDRPSDEAARRRRARIIDRLAGLASDVVLATRLLLWLSVVAVAVILLRIATQTHVPVPPLNVGITGSIALGFAILGARKRKAWIARFAQWRSGSAD